MSRAVSSQLQLQKNQYVIGDIGFFLLITSTISLFFIGTFYGLFPQYSFPVLFGTLLGWTGFVLALASGALLLKVQRVVIKTVMFSISALVIIIVIGGIATLIKAPQAQAGTIITILDPIFLLMFFGSIGVMEEFGITGRGLYATLRKLFPGWKAWLFFISPIQALLGIAFHQAVALTLFQGTIFSTPGYFVWIGISWFVYSFVLEVTKNFGANTLTHFLLNTIVTLINLDQLGMI